MLAVTGETLADVGEPETARAIEDDVIRTAEPLAVERIVDTLEAARGEIDALDAARRVVGSSAQRKAYAVHVAPLESAVVADVDRTLGSERRAVRPAAEIGDHFAPSVPDARQRTASDLDQHDGAVGQRDRAFGKLQTFGDDFEVHPGTKLRSRVSYQEFLGRLAQVVARAHRAAVGAGGRDQQHVAFL